MNPIWNKYSLNLLRWTQGRESALVVKRIISQRNWPHKGANPLRQVFRSIFPCVLTVGYSVRTCCVNIYQVGSLKSCCSICYCWPLSDLKVLSNHFLVWTVSMAKLAAECGTVVISKILLPIPMGFIQKHTKLHTGAIIYHNKKVLYKRFTRI